ncbi:related to 2-3-cyclic-nucleotide 3-phosphodiesterase [Fusarium oxysporum]|uniref:Related to 2-3-cyclic-nucleotide 3-phosphodiesterase n=1 Tax=Fusarium oxysporum TaxID=5507 RepID=A0A2H3T0J9_FUSOX|nr:related to 2-3-cyclic-nucleotide 3-phosphodiesterase [Fusarium oxysporum]
MTSTSASPTAWATINPSKPTVIGLYGLPATGKSTVLEGLRNKLGETEFAFFEGSDVISYLVPGDLKAFQKFEDPEKKKWRAEAITHIKNEAAASGKIAVVTGHFMFWSKEDSAPYAVYTPEDLETFTQIIYLNPNALVLLFQVMNDMKKNRFDMTGLSAENWHFRELAPAGSNLAQVKKRLDEIIALHNSKELQTFLVFDGDRTLSAEDGGRLLVDQLEQNGTGLKDSAMRGFFKKCDDDMFEFRCDNASAFVPLYPEFISLLRCVEEQKHIGVVVVTCGVGRLWTKILEHHGLSDSVKVIGGGRFSDGYFVTPGVKAAVVSHLRDVHDLNVWAFGDSPLDIPMLWEEKKRSTIMDAALATAIQDGHLRARQVLLPSTSSPRLDNNSLPVVSFDDGDFVKSIVDPRPERRPLKKYDATNKAASNILMSPMRSAAVSGPMLRAAHANVGRYLATEYVSKLIGLEEYTISHLQGHQTTGHRLRNEAKTSIVALMRGGEPMAFGISDVFPQAMFVHASSADDVKKHHVQGQSNVILVGSVINSGKSVIELIKRVVCLEPNISITVVAGVVQTEAIAEGHLFAKVMRRHGDELITLRISENKFTGTKTTDTGNRLFNTTRLA